MTEAFCKWLIGGMATAIVAMAGFIVTLVRAERAARREQVEMQKEHEDVLRATLEEVVKRREVHP